MQETVNSTAEQIAGEQARARWIWARRPLRLAAHILPYPVVGLALLLTQSGWVAMLAYHLSIVGVLCFGGGWRESALLLRQGWRPTWLLLLCLGMGLSGGLLLFYLWPLLGVALAGPAIWAAFGLSNSGRTLFVVYFCLVNPALEESYWRGYLGSPSIRPTFSDLCFAGYHLLVVAALVAWHWMALIFIVLAAAAWFWRQLARSAGGLGLPLAAHAAADVSIMIALLLLPA